MKRILSGLLAAALLVAGLIVPMPAAFAGNVDLEVAGRVTGAYSGSGFGAGTQRFDERYLLQLATGTGTGQADLVYAGQRTLAASGSENLDLAGGLTDAFGSTLTFVDVKAILVFASASNTNSVVVGGAASNAFTGPWGGTTPTTSIPPGGFAVFSHPGAGWTVTASTGDILKVANSGGSTGVTYRIVVIGASA